jgi:hypothetical protein
VHCANEGQFPLVVLAGQVPLQQAHGRMFKYVMSEEHGNGGYTSLVCMGVKRGHFMVLLLLLLLSSSSSLSLYAGYLYTYS